MAKGRGRPRKQGKRTKSGKLSRPADLRLVRGNDRAEARKALYGADASDPIGRAYAAGLLGDDGKQLLDTARAIFRAYWAWYAVGPYACPLGNRTGSTASDDLERERRQEDWLNGMLAIRDRTHPATRRLFDQLVIDVNPDEGPAWLDRLLTRRGDGHDSARLVAVLAALGECAGLANRRAA